MVRQSDHLRIQCREAADGLEWPFVVVGMLLAALPLAATAGLLLERDWGWRLARIAAWLMTLVGAVVLLYGLMLLTWAWRGVS